MALGRHDFHVFRNGRRFAARVAGTTAFDMELDGLDNQRAGFFHSPTGSPGQRRMRIRAFLQAPSYIARAGSDPASVAGHNPSTAPILRIQPLFRGCVAHRFCFRIWQLFHLRSVRARTESGACGRAEQRGRMALGSAR